ncbi:hypothetical protein THIOM_000446 [Candidatus Thiomargarita nelsonii]|uniref:Uncharacterized protein n=1 Tax=Candidatus Thiomargarita nelsonii TaxID=1003181 RepID=A0A176S6F1_9GAMM|nr:hypothetical protein THIOM_000446 [Candidatus Thiomargarita nelsonii]
MPPSHNNVSCSSNSKTRPQKPETIPIPSYPHVRQVRCGKNLPKGSFPECRAFGKVRAIE